MNTEGEDRGPVRPAEEPNRSQPGFIARVIAASAERPFFTVLLVLALAAWGWWSLGRGPLDAIPDLSDVQVIVFTEWMGQSPDLVEDQITYPITTALLAAPKVRSVRGQSMFGMSFVYVIFDDGTDIYWARSRVLEYLNEVQDSLPDGTRPTLGPDATGVGWVFQYALVDESGQMDLAQLRSLQDWNLRYALESVEGVAEVASVGGFVKQYQVQLDPNRLLAFNVPFNEVVDAIRASNEDVGGRVLEVSGHEYVVRGRGYVQGIADWKPFRPRSAPAALRSSCATWPRSPGAGPAARLRRARRPRRGRGRHRDHALWRERAQRDRCGQGPSRRGPEEPPRRSQGRHHLRPLAAHPGIGGHPAQGADRRDAGGQPRDFRLPPACAERPGAGDHLADRRAPRLHPHVLPGADDQHHLPGRHHRGRGCHGGCLDDPDRKHS